MNKKKMCRNLAGRSVKNKNNNPFVVNEAKIIAAICRYFRHGVIISDVLMTMLARCQLMSGKKSILRSPDWVRRDHIGSNSHSTKEQKAISCVDVRTKIIERKRLPTTNIKWLCQLSMKVYGYNNFLKRQWSFITLLNYKEDSSSNMIFFRPFQVKL